MSFYFLLINQPFFQYAILVTSSRDHQASNLSRPKETRPVKGWGWLRFQTGGYFEILSFDFVSCFVDVRSWHHDDWCVSAALFLVVTVRIFNLLQPHNQSCHRSLFKIYLCSPVTPCLSGDKRTDADQATVVEWIVYDQRNEKRVCMNATSNIYIYIYITTLYMYISYIYVLFAIVR